MTYNPDQSVVTIKKPSRVGGGLGLILSLLLLVLPGIAVLGFAEKHKPTLTNALANGGDVLTPSAYQGVHAFALLMLVGGAVLALICIVRMASRPAAVSVTQPAPRTPDLPQFPPPAREARQPAPTA
ncbi:MAG TPA: hypothetical protein VJT75_04570 [Thermoleophilaceae bacterium]|nr:hypothetical protein [Thermoleophilaceae bacterium]